MILKRIINADTRYICITNADGQKAIIKIKLHGNRTLYITKLYMKFRAGWANAPDGPPTLSRKALSEELQNPLKTRLRSSEARLSSFRILERTSSFSDVVGWFFFLLPFYSFHQEEKVSPHQTQRRKKVI